MRLPTRFHILVAALRVRVISPRRNTLILVGSFADPSYQLRVLRYPEPYATTEALRVESVFQAP